MRDHGVVDGISVLGDVEVFLDDALHVGEERPVGADSAPIFIRLSDVVGANRDKPARFRQGDLYQWGAPVTRGKD